MWSNLGRGNGRAPGGRADQESLVVPGPDGDAHVAVALHAPHPGEGLVDRQAGAKAANKYRHQADDPHCSDKVE